MIAVDDKKNVKMLSLDDYDKGLDRKGGIPLCLPLSLAAVRAARFGMSVPLNPSIWPTVTAVTASVPPAVPTVRWWG
jgi:hypothetical protein